MAEEFSSSDNRILLSGADKYHTTDVNGVYHVESGVVYIYVVRAAGKNVGRSIFVSEAEAGEDIPALFKVDKTTGSGWMFRLIPKHEAVLTRTIVDGDRTEYEKEFLEKHLAKLGPIGSYEDELVDWYDDKLRKEAAVIAGAQREKQASENAKLSLIESLFVRRRTISFDFETDSDLYNAMSTMCAYLNLNICSYRTLVSSRGNDFTPTDVARASHFVLRKITLSKNWYRENGPVFLAFTQDTGKPIICIPKHSGAYMIYDVEQKTEKVADEEDARNLDIEGYVAYQHLPKDSLRIRDVFNHGIMRIDTSDVVLFFTMYILVTLLGLLMPVIYEQLYDHLIPLGSMDAIYQVGVVIFSGMITNVFFGLVQDLASFRAIKKMEYFIVASTYDRIFRLPQKFIDKFGTAELVSRVNSVSGVFSSTLISGTTAVVGFVLSFVYLGRMFKHSKVLAWRGLVMALFTAVVMYFFGRLRISRERQQLEASASANGKLYHFMSGILKIKVSGIENRSLFEFQKSNVESLKYTMRSTTISNVSSVFSTIMAALYTGFIYYTIIKKKVPLSIGSYTSFNSAYGMFTSSVTQLVSFFLTLATLIPVMDRVRPIFAEPTEYSDYMTDIGSLDGRVEVNHLDFAYEGESNLILKDVSFEINPGEFVGIVGPSGCGKSTLLKCLLGFEDATKGNIFYDDKDIRSLDKIELRRQTGVVLQDGKIVVGNIYTNVTLSAPNMEPDEALELLKTVDFYDDVIKMPMGIFTGVSEGGGTVSGGQQQRILLARALANNPKILFLDEATSALDNVTQAQVCANLKDRNITRVMIAHRLSTVKDCDKILVMDKGRIVESGNFEELMNLKGHFYELAKRQQV